MWSTKVHYSTITNRYRIEIAIPGSESRDWQRLYPRISGLQKLAKIVLFRVLNDINKTFCGLVNKIFYER